MLTRKRTLKNLIGVTVLFLAIAVIILIAISIRQSKQAMATPINQTKRVVIDAGHGGIDPGAVGVDGISEKDINLNIALCLKDILIANGYEAFMTRESDISINKGDKKTIAAIKTADLKERLKIIEENTPTIAISIHQNKYPSEKAHGAQMFYGRKNEQSKLLAQAIQTKFVENLQPENKRQIKRSTSDVYIIHNANVPIVLVECGFLSNYNEAKLLVDEEYQQRIAFTIFMGIIECDNIPQENQSNVLTNGK